MKSCIKRHIAFTSAFIFLSAASLISMVPGTIAQISDNESWAMLTVSENGKLSLKAEGVSLKTLLAQVQAKTKVQYDLSEKHVNIPISLTFQSLPLNEAIKRILHGISHACILNSEGNIERIITFARATSPGRLVTKPDEPAISYTTKDDFPIQQERNMQPKTIQPARMPPPEVMEVLKDELAPVAPPGAIQEIE